MTNAFHQTTITDKHKGMVINDIKSRFIKFCRHQFFSECHTDGIGNALAQGPSGRFNSGCDVNFGVSRGFRVELPKCSQLIHGQVVTRKMQKCIQEH